MSEDEPRFDFFSHGLGPRRPRQQPPSTRKRSLRVEPEGIARYGHGLGPPSPKFVEVEAFDEATPLSPAQQRTLIIALLTLGAVSIGTLAIIEAIERHNCERDPQRASCDRTSASSYSGSGGGGGSAGGYGHSVSFGGFGSSSAGHYGGGA
jgi:uncharacterized membrane protein YgcG